MAGDAGAGDDVAYCDAVAELNQLDGPPTIEMMQAYASVAPEAAQELVSSIIDVVEANDGNFMAVLTDEEGNAALESLTAIEEDVCGAEAGGPQQDPSVTQIDPAATRVDIRSTEYAFDIAPPSTSGRYSFVSSNEGAEAHLLILLRLEPGATLDQAMASEGEEGVADIYESDVAPPGGRDGGDGRPHPRRLGAPLPGPRRRGHPPRGPRHGHRVLDHVT